MKALCAAGIAIVCAATAAMGDGTPVSGDFYMVSRSDRNDFHGSHRIFQRPSADMRKVVYCARAYWVRARTVAWTQLQVDDGRIVRVEYNRGSGWRPICEDPERQVSLKDLGIALEPQQVMHSLDDHQEPQSFFDAFKKSFQDAGAAVIDQTYHSR
ncbi:MAG: hypothetical protein JJ902_05805 [Roseibium sp.]|nr:hypothetical protein [Roseibium sp.]